MRLAQSAIFTVLAVALGVAFGNATSSATELCSEVAEACKEASVVKEGTAVKGALKGTTKSNLVTSAGTIACEGSSLEGKTSEKEDMPLQLEVTGLSFSSCRLGLAKCTVTSLSLPYASVMYALDAGNGTIYMEGTPGRSVACAGVIECSYTAPEIELSLTAGTPATLVAKEAPLEGEGKICAQASWSAEYSVSAPSEGQVGAAQGSGTTRLCKANEASCTQVYPKGTALAGPKLQVVSVSLEPLGYVIQCPESSIEAVTEQEAGVVLKTELKKLEFLNCKTGKNVCTVQTTGLPYTQTRILRAVPPFGAAGEGAWQMRLRLEVNCAALGVEGCQYEKLAVFKVESGNPGRVWTTPSLSKLRRKPNVGLVCGAYAEPSLAYPLSQSPNKAIYVTG